jgi:TolA-binding protein
MVGGHEKQSESNTTSTSSSASASASAVSADWLIAPPLQNVRVDTQYVGTIEEQKQQIRQLQEELAEFNCV